MSVSGGRRLKQFQRISTTGWSICHDTSIRFLSPKRVNRSSHVANRRNNVAHVVLDMFHLPCALYSVPREGSNLLEVEREVYVLCALPELFVVSVSFLVRVLACGMRLPE